MISVHTNLAARMAAAALSRATRASEVARAELSTGVRASDPAAQAVAQQLQIESTTKLAVADTLSATRGAAQVGMVALSEIDRALDSLREMVVQSAAPVPDSRFAEQRTGELLRLIDGMRREATLNGTNLITGGQAADGPKVQAAALVGTDGRRMSVGGTGLAILNASLPGLGLAGFALPGSGVQLSFGGAPSALLNPASDGTTRTIRLATPQFDAAGAETPEYGRREWTFDLVPAGSGVSPSTTVSATYDALGNVATASTVATIPVAAGDSPADIAAALRDALRAQGFAAEVADGLMLHVAGHNVTRGADVSLTGFPAALDPSHFSEGLRRPNPVLAGSTTLPLAFPYRWDGRNLSLGELQASSIELDPDALAPYLAPGTTITGVDPVNSTVTLNQPTLIDIPAGASLNLRRPASRVATWAGADAGLAVLDFATRQSTGIAATLGDAIGTIETRQASLRQGADATLAAAGYLIDVDIPKSQAKLLAARIREELAAQSLGIANRSPEMILALFKAAATSS